MTQSNFGNFMSGFAAAPLQAQRAKENGFHLERLLLLATFVDASLRMILILHDQLIHDHNHVDETLIFQKDRDDFLSERQIINRIEKEKCAPKNITKELHKLYERRNRAVHRFFLSDVKYSEFEEIADHYDSVVSGVLNVINALEVEQMRQGKGMTRSQGPKDISSEEMIKNMRKSKMGQYDS